MNDDDSRYFERLYARIDCAVKVPYRCAPPSERTTPRLNACHTNVNRWVADHPGSKAVRGWTFWAPMEDGRCRFWAHSVVDEGGALVDITPMDANTPRDTLLFLRHEGTEAEFGSLKARCAEITYPLLTFEEWQACQAACAEGVSDSEGEVPALVD